MEGIQTIQALKAVQSSLPAQTTIPSDELVMLYAADGTPIAKIARDDLVKAVASVMASNSQNTFSKLLGVQANGTPMGIGASDLASVLGVNLGILRLRVNHGESTTVDRAGYGIVIIGNVSGGTCGLYIIANRSASHFGGTDLSSVVSLTKPSEYGLTISNISSADNVDCIIFSV